MSQDLKKLAETLVNLPVKDVNELATILKEEHGIEPAAAAPVMMAAAGEAAPAAEEQTSFDVILKGVGSGSKLNIIKAVKAITGLGLPDSKALVDGAPKPVKEGVSKDEAENVRKQLEEAGAEVEVK